MRSRFTASTKLVMPRHIESDPDPDGAAGVTAVKTLSDFRERSFAQNYGVLVKEGPLAGLTARAVFVVGKDGKVKHAEYVKEITTEPNYDAALNAARQAAGA